MDSLLQFSEGEKEIQLPGFDKIHLKKKKEKRNLTCSPVFERRKL